MKKRKILVFCISILLCFYFQSRVLSQQLISSAGDTYKNNSYQLDWSVGELQTETYINANSILTQGFHQSNYVITIVKQVGNLQFEIVAFPNPATDYIQLKIEGASIGNLLYKLADVDGRVVLTNKITNKLQRINLCGVIDGVYFLYVQTNNQTVTTFKILKSN